jgi:predicted RNase H-like HicB family nuclease
MKQIKINVKGETLTPVITYHYGHSGYYTGTTEEHSGIITQGYSFENILRNIVEASEVFLEEIKCTKCIHFDDYGCLMEQLHDMCNFQLAYCNKRDNPDAEKGYECAGCPATVDECPENVVLRLVKDEEWKPYG